MVKRKEKREKYQAEVDDVGTAYSKKKKKNKEEDREITVFKNAADPFEQKYYRREMRMRQTGKNQPKRKLPV
eukprot:CAMPEP_0197516826 /NCGR_PEP_ID=MMETSP1318-20131121/1743_1 /TAXON_ID=552666 /ORGANISM="Partenskyella glossopodia, Strain RCC365" /LENGTH=71 /DNA_ID=CAMNT_0043065861 /DNA_START=268 /DNA_END=483 /DNA_ORIENTATION=+